MRDPDSMTRPISSISLKSPAARESSDFYVFVDFHQDVWSRMSGGDGAPGWTFEAVGLDFTKFHAAGAAHVMQYKYDYAKGGRQDAYPQMTWSSNYRLPANHDHVDPFLRRPRHGSAVRHRR